MDLYKEYEDTIKKIFEPQDLIIATLLREALCKNGCTDLRSSLARASGILMNKLPLVSEVLFEFLNKFPKEKNDKTGNELGYGSPCKNRLKNIGQT
ncbi:MAG: hypothetical protein SV375_17325 [Thermodesulfobacteriota bacterium]|nr:hypothetical protein [Thermodesulfobacteriota bacterium]